MEFVSRYAVDLGVLAIVLISVLVAWRRGFVAETLSLGGWFGAGIATLYGFPYVRPLAGQLVGGGILADIVAAVGLFLVALALFAFLGSALSRRIRDSSLGGVDRTLGVVFGALRGVLIAVLLYIGVQWAWSGETMPASIARSHAAPLLGQGADVLRALVPGSERTRTPVSVEASPEAPAETEGKSGYSKRELGDMQRLIESKQ